mgnify:CR=1 FL=1
MKELNLTQGSVPKVLLQFAVPFLIANVLQALYGGADLFVVGQYDDSASVAAVAIGSQVMQTITGIILGITTGTTVLIAIATGASSFHHRFVCMVVFNNRGAAYFGHGGFSWSDSRVNAYADRGDGGYEKLHPCMFGRDIVYSRI